MATLQNIGVLKYRDKNGNWKPLPVVLQSSGGGSGGISTISGKGQPGTSTVGRLNQLYRDESTDKLYICTGDDGSYTWAAVVSDTEDAVTYTVQTLTNAQKAQARTNIGAGTSNFSGSYNDLTNKPNIPAASVIDTTLSKAGQAADAKTVGDALANKADTTAVSSALASKANVATVDAALAEVDAALANKANKTEIPNVPSWAMASRKPTYTASEVGALPNTTVIPDVSGKLDKSQGTANAGKFLVVGTDGNIATKTMSEWAGGSY